MEDSFTVRVDKVFGSLGTTTTTETTPSSSSLWTLTDQEIERRHWIPNKNDDDEDEEEEAVELDNQDDEDEDEIDREKPKKKEEEINDDLSCSIINNNNNNNNKSSTSIVDEDWDVESNIGRDCTLDFEEEEDKYDKLATGMEQSGDRFYMKDVKFGDYESHELNTYGELPISYDAVERDPRANHTAAKLRLKEDAEAAGNFDTLQLSDNSKLIEGGGGVDEVDNLKPILKKRETNLESRSQKRVRFMLDDREEEEEEEEEQKLPSGPADGMALEMISSCSKNDDAMPKQASRHFYDVPDYIKNPSKYTHYTFDSSADDMDEQSNQKAFAELSNRLRGKDADNHSLPTADVPKSVPFTPKRKSEPKCGDAKLEGGDLNKKGRSIGITAEDPQDAMEEDEPCLPPNKAQKSGRRYRARTNPNDVEDDLDMGVD